MATIAANVSPNWLVRNVEVWEGDRRLQFVTAVDVDEGWVDQLVVERLDPGGGPIFKRDAQGLRVAARRSGAFHLVDPTSGRRIG